MNKKVSNVTHFFNKQTNDSLSKLFEKNKHKYSYNHYYEKIGNKIIDITDEIPFEIPKTWVWVRHKELFQFVGGSQPSKDKFIFKPRNGYVRLYQIRDYGDKPEPTYIPFEDATKQTQKDDILLARYGGSLGKVFFAEEGAYNVALAKIVFLENQKIEKKYVFYFYCSDIYQSFVHTTSARSAQGGFNSEEIGSLFFPLPPLAEQRRIVSKLEQLEPLLDEYEKLVDENEKLDNEFPNKLKQSILQYAMEGKLVQQDPNDEPATVLLEKIKQEKERLIKEGKAKRDKSDSTIYQGDDKKYYEKMPSNWNLVHLGDLCNIQTGATFEKGQANAAHDIRVMRGGNILDNNLILKIDDIFITKDLISDEILLRADDLITPSVSSLENIGKIALIHDNYLDTTVGGFVYILRPYFQNDIFATFLYYFLQTPRSIETLKSYTKKSGSAFYNLSKEKFKAMDIYMPPFGEQRKIDYKLNSLFNILKI